jgi:hypothetical protein
MSAMLKRATTIVARRGYLAGLVGVAVLAAACGRAAAVAPSAKTPSVASVLSRVDTTLSGQTGVHIVVTTRTTSTEVPETVIADFGTATGIEKVTAGKATLTVEVTPNGAYMGGSPTGLTSLLGLTAKEAAKVGTRWVSFASSTTEYASLKSTTTISSLTHGLPAAKGTTLAGRIEKGANVDVLSWTSAATSTTLKLSNTLTVASYLPTSERSDSSTGYSTETFSDWGESVHVSTPAVSATIPSTAVTG